MIPANFCLFLTILLPSTRCSHPSELMKNSYLPLIFVLAMASGAVAQTSGVSAEDEAFAKHDEAVYQAGTLIQPVPEIAKGPANKGAVHFAEGFASESSEEALLSTLEKAVLKDPDHICEIVKEAILISKANRELVAKIVETACLAAPEKMRIIAQCAIASSPDSLADIQMVLAKFDPATGDGGVSSKSGKESLDKSGKVVVPPQPPVQPLMIRIDTPPPLIPFVPPVISYPSTNNDLR